MFWKGGPMQTPNLTSEQTIGLLRIRRLLEAASDNVRRVDDISPGVAMILTDQAAEGLAGVVANHLGIPVNKDWSIPRLIDAIIKKASETKSLDLSFIKPLGSLRDRRNSVQHRLIVPLQGEARRHHDEVKAILRQLLSAVFGVQFQDLRLLAARDFRGSIVKSVEAFNKTIARWTTFVQQLFGLVEGPNDIFGNAISTVSSGISLPELNQFQIATGTHSKGHYTLPFREPPADWGSGMADDSGREEIVAMALDFVCRLAVHLETLYPP
jgi:hypothetical protein